MSLVWKGIIGVSSFFVEGIIGVSSFFVEKRTDTNNAHPGLPGPEFPPTPD
jgi:hypothetical protein